MGQTEGTLGSDPTVAVEETWGMGSHLQPARPSEDVTPKGSKG